MYENTCFGGNVRTASNSLVECELVGNEVGRVQVFVQSQAAIDRPLSPISSPRQSLYPYFTTAEGCEVIYRSTSPCASHSSLRDRFCPSTLSAFCLVPPRKSHPQLGQSAHMLINRLYVNGIASGCTKSNLVTPAILTSDIHRSGIWGPGLES